MKMVGWSPVPLRTRLGVGREMTSSISAEPPPVIPRLGVWPGMKDKDPILTILVVSAVGNELLQLVGKTGRRIPRSNRVELLAFGIENQLPPTEWADIWADVAGVVEIEGAGIKLVIVIIFSRSRIRRVRARGIDGIPITWVIRKPCVARL